VSFSPSTIFSITLRSARERRAPPLKVSPALLYHRANTGDAMTPADPETALLDEVQRLYDGPVVTALDLKAF